MSNVGYATLTVVPTAQGFKSALERQVSGPLAQTGRRAGRDAGKAAGSGMTAGFAPAMKRLVPLVGAAFAGISAAGFLKGAIAEASSLDESINAVRVSYGKAANDILKLGDNSARTFGLSKLELNEFAVRFSGFAGTIAGKTGDSAKVFEQITQRATDFASVMNLEVAEAAQLFQSGLAGETEPLRRFGIDMSAAAVETFAYANGIAKSGEKLTEAQKQQARFALLLEQTEKTAGDFENTSGGLANQQKILGAQWNNLKATLGSAFVPILAKVVALVNDKVIPVLSGWAAAVKPAVDAFLGFVSGIGSGEGALSGVSAVVGRIGDAFKGLFDLIVKGDFTGALRNAFGVAEDSAFVGFVLDIRDAFIKLVPTVVGTARSIVTSLRDAFTAVLPTLQTVAGVIFNTVVPAVGELGTFLLTTVVPAVASFARFVGEEILPRIVGFAKTVGENMLPAFRAISSAVATRIVPAFKVLVTAILGVVEKIKPFLTFLVRLAGVIVGVASKIIGFLIPIILKLAGPIFSFLIKIVAKVIEWVGKIIGWVGDFGNKILDSGETVTKFARTVRDKIGDVVRWFRDLPGKVRDKLGDLGKLLVEKGKDLIRGLIDGAGSMLSSLGRFFLDKVPGWIREPFKRALGIASPSKVFADYGRNVGEGFVKGIEGQERAVRSAVLAMGASAASEPLLAVDPPAVPDVAATGGAGSVARGGFAPTIINNYPEPEKASDALPVALRRAAFAGGF